MTYGGRRLSLGLWTVGVLVLSPLVLAAGVLALVGAAMVAASGYLRGARRRTARVAPVGAGGVLIALRPDRRAEAPGRATVELPLGRAA